MKIRLKFTLSLLVGVIGLLGASFPAAQAATSTTHYSLTKPAVNDPVDQDLWGAELNTNFDVIDTTMFALGNPAESAITFTDITTNNVSSTLHGFAPKSPADATKFLNGAATPAFAAVKDSDLSTTDITTNNVSASKHGFAPKNDGDSTHFLNGAGAYTAPAVSSPTKSWVTYNIAGSATLAAASNVSSVVKNAGGNITINFSPALADANYSVTGSTDSGGNAVLEVVSATTSALNVIFHVTNTGGNYDASRASVVITGN